MTNGSDSENAMFSGSKTSVLEQIEESFFFVLYVMHEKTKGSNVHPNFIAMILEMLVTFIHLGGYILSSQVNFGNLTHEWGKIIVFLQFRAPYRPGYYSPDFLIAFWFMISVTFVVVGISVMVAISFHRRSFQFTWPLRVLNFIIAVFIRFFVVSALSILLTPAFCDPRYNKLHAFHEVACFRDIPELLMGLISSVVLAFFVVAYTLSEVEHKIIPNALLTATTPHFNLALFITTIIFILEGDFLGDSIIGEWFQIFSFCIMLLFLFFLLIYKMPYQSFMVCAIRAGSLATLTWMSFLAFVSMHMEKNPDKNNRPLDFALVLGLLPSFLVGYFLAKLRRNFLLNACENLILRCKQRTSVEPHNDSHPGKVGASDVVSSEFIEKFSQDPFVIKYVKTMNNVELIGRYLVQMKKYQIADCWYRVALTHHQVSALAHILCYHFMEVQRATNYQDNFGSIETDWEALSRFEPYFYLRFICFRQKMESDKQSATANIANHGDKLDLLQYVEFRKSYQLAKKYHARCIDSIQQFWILFLVQNVSFRGFQTALRTINTNTKMADSFYKNLLFRYPKATHILNAYSNFAALVLNDSDTAEHYHQLAINAQAREAEMQSEGMSLGGLLGAPSNNAVVTINIEGVILEVNAIALQMFGYHSKNDLLQRKINALMPFPYKLVHDQFLEKYKKTGVKNILGVRQNLFGLHLHGYAFIVDIQIVELKRRELTFAGLITQHTTEKEKACICINREGLIQFFTKPVLSMFGYTPQELIGSNVKILMTKEYASQHDIYLSTYLETGEGRVIGNGMRMVMGMHKCGKFISIGLEVRKDTVAGEIYYFGTLVDMEELVGEILINAYGEIVTCNEDTTALLGYQLNEMVGNNIKMIMPEPYASFHDMYLERYRKTKKGLIVDSPEGRILTVRNKLGSCFAVNLIVKKLENTSELLYQGLMRRLPAGELEDKSGDTKSNMIYIFPNMKVMAYGICINRLLQVNGSYFVGKSLERIFPPCLSLIYQNDIRTLIRFLLDNSDFFHYVYYLRSDNTLHPCAVMAQEEFDGRISLVMEDLKNKEGLIRINEICIVQDVNDAISYLFGYNEEEILGKNVSMIMPSDIAKEHDGYIKRYLESKEKKLLGISRTLTGKHKDDIMFQVALEVIEKNTDGERLFLARIRHSTVPSQKLDMELFRKLRGSMTQLDDTGTNFLKSGFPDEKNKSKLGIPKGQEQKLPLLNPSIIRTMKQTQSTTELQGSLNISGSATTNHNKSIKITVDSEKTTSNPITNSGDIPTNGALLTAVPHLNSNPYGGSNKSIAFKEKAISPTQKGELNTPQKSALKQAFIRSAPLMEEEFKTNLGDDSKKTDYMEEDEEKANKDLEEVRRRSITKFESERKSNDSVVIFNKLELLKKEKPMDLLTSKVKKDAKDTSDTTSSYSQSAASTGGPNGNARDMKLIMLWKNTKSNPLHVKFQRRQIHAGILVTSALTLLSIISYLLYYQGIDSYEASFYTGFSQINRIYASIGRFAICRSRPTMSFCTAVPIQDWDTEWNGFSSNYTSTLEKMYTAYLQNYASLQNILPLDIYVFTHPNESISEKAESNFWALNKDIISSVSTLAIKTVAPQRQLNFLLGNKKVVLQEYQRLLLSIRASEQRDLETSTIYHNIAIGCTIFTVVMLFFFYTWSAFRELNLERSKALVLIMEIPKGTIHDLAYKVYDPESEFDDSESLGADENFEVRDLTIERSVQEESVVEKRLQEGKSFMSKKKTNSIDKLPNEKKEVVQTDIFTSILIVCLYLSTIVTPITLMLLNDFYYVPETYRFLAMLSDFVSIFCKVVPLTHQIMDSSLNLMTSEARTELLASLSTLKIEIGAFQLEMGLHSLDNTVQSMLTSQTCFREGGCENVQALEGTNDGLAFILYVITEKMTLFLNIQEPYDPILLAELQTYLSQLTWFYLQYAMSTFSQGLIHSFNLFCQTSLSVALDLHIISILVAGIAFLFMHIIQRNMREDIKQNCLLLLMIPPNIISKQRPLKNYIKQICADIKRNLGTHTEPHSEERE